jgi:hypothetical protein
VGRAGAALELGDRDGQGLFLVAAFRDKPWPD